MGMQNLFKCKLGTTLLILPLILVACTNHTQLIFVSIPEGATISEISTGNALGIAPTWKRFDLDSLSSLDSEGCYILGGVAARWVSGATAQMEEIKLCDGKSGFYAVRLFRPTEHPDLEKDLEEATARNAARFARINDLAGATRAMNMGGTGFQGPTMYSPSDRSGAAPGTRASGFGRN